MKTLLYTLVTITAHSSQLEWSSIIPHESSSFSYSSILSPSGELAISIDYGDNTYIYIFSDSGDLTYTSPPLSTSNPAQFRSFNDGSLVYTINNLALYAFSVCTLDLETYESTFTDPLDGYQITLSPLLGSNPFFSYELTFSNDELTLQKYTISDPVEVPLTSFPPDTNNNYTLSWETKEGVEYYIQVSPDAETYTDFSDSFTGNGSVAEYAFPYAPERRFFRVVTK